jgi:hypothetical protein
VNTFLALAAAIGGLSGLATVVYERISQRPKIGGRVFQAIKGKTVIRGRKFTSVIVFLHLTNNRRNPISILEYELEAFVDDDWLPLPRSYGANLEQQALTDAAGRSFTITKDTMVNWKPQAIAHGVPLQGFIQFLADENLYAKTVTAWRLTLVDEFDRRHVVSTSSLELGDPFRVFELAHMSPTPGWIASADARADAAESASQIGEDAEIED